jgi:protein-tyrosine kinase
MEQIKQAVERAKASANTEQLSPVTTPDDHNAARQGASTAGRSQTKEYEPTDGKAASPAQYNSAKLSWPHLEKHRIVAHNVADLRAKTFDVLRTQALQAMDQKNWQFLAVTSPTEGCGKTVTAINLALSIARQPGRSALLIDMDLQRPAVADYMGINCQLGVRSILEGKAKVADATIRAHAENCELLVLPAEASTVRSSELVTSPHMNSMLLDIKRMFRSRTVIFDMPPLLQGDEVLATLPRIDCVLLVTAVGVSTLHEIKECSRHLQASEVIRVVLNKTHEPASKYYY